MSRKNKSKIVKNNSKISPHNNATIESLPLSFFVAYTKETGEAEKDFLNSDDLGSAIGLFAQWYHWAINNIKDGVISLFVVDNVTNNEIELRRAHFTSTADPHTIA